MTAAVIVYVVGSILLRITSGDAGLEVGARSIDGESYFRPESPCSTARVIACALCAASAPVASHSTDTRPARASATRFATLGYPRPDDHL